ncbi:LexA family transcriptional regulator [Falsiroseomonas sp. CW058]|uniref:LexA family transcriptional regulator n=1 Tax=Falsiroseomonas sp. CW058 TaxID=3388664 RepID=UPI003D314334
MEAKLACELGEGEAAALPVLLERHGDMLAILATKGKATLAADRPAAAGHYGQMPTRLQELLDAKGLSAADLARMAGVQPSTLSKLTTGKRRLGLHWARRFAPHLGVSPAELIVEPGEAALSESQPFAEEGPRDPPHVPRGYVLVREYVADGAAGGGRLPVDWQEGKQVVAEWVVPRDLLPPEHRNAKVAVVRVVGDSMTPLLRPYDRVMVDVGHNFMGPDGTYLAWNGMGIVFKRLQAMPGDPPRIRFSSDNPAYEPYVVPADEVHVLGRVIGVWTWL